MRAVILAVLLAGLWAVPAHADDGCLQAPDELPPAQPVHAVRFGITPQFAGSVGTAQGSVVGEDEARADRALLDLRPPGRELVLRLNRLFEADGAKGIDRFAVLVDAYAALGFRSEVQVRYHPAAAQEGDMAAWEAFVREAVTTLGRRRAVVAFSITNEANFPVSDNTSDGNYAGALDAIVRGIVAGRRALDQIGRADVPVGFTVAWRYAPNADVNFWKGIGARVTPEFLASLGYVGLQLYPGLVWPPAPLPGRDAGLETRDALAIVRTCHMVLGKLPPTVPLWITEQGYATNLGRTTTTQADDLTSTLTAVHAVSGTLNVTDFRYFNLRDNDSDGTDLFAAVGVLDDTYAAKPAFAVLQNAIAGFGTAPATAATPRPAAHHRRHRTPRRHRRP